MHKKLVLASQSPRRRELVTKLGVPFSVISPTGEELLDPALTIQEQIENISEAKAMSVFETHRENVVLGSDTVVVCDGKILGKPRDEKDAFDMLRMLSNREHTVVTGVCIVSSENKHVFSVTSSVTFYEITDEEIERYIATKEPLDKAGSYSIQEMGAVFVKEIRGDFYSIMGLPISRVYQCLTKEEW